VKLVERVLNAEHKVLSGPVTLLLYLALFLVLFGLARFGIDGTARPLQEHWVRAALAAAGVLGVLAWAERDRPYPQSGREGDDLRA